MSDQFLRSLLKLLNVVLFAVHLEHVVDVFLRDDESLTEVLCYTLFDVVSDGNLLVVGLAVHPVGLRLHRYDLSPELKLIESCHMLFKS